VAHRLSTVQHADQVVYIEDGKVVGMGTFEELRKSIPQLQRQIELGTLDLLS
jgi:ABC-type multidrug transport system fused ATPase/permease subunit